MSQLHEISGCRDSARKADVVFLHGLGGDALATWRHGSDDSTSWPHWLGAEFPQVGVWSLGYAASPTRWARLQRLFGRGSRDSGHSMALPDRALQVLDLFVQRGICERPLLLICHSLGGLLAKELLRNANDSHDPRKRAVVSQTRGILFVATPHAGAGLATAASASAFSTVFATTVTMEELRAHDAHLRNLFNWYRNNAPGFGITTVTYYETRDFKGVVPIVNPTSAHPGVGADPVALDEDHASIAKPRARDDQICGAARALLRDYVLSIPPTISTAPKRETPQSASPPTPPAIVIKLDRSAQGVGESSRVPRELPPAAGRFFGRAVERKRLVERLRAGLNTAVVGPAGLGKTALAADALQEVVGVNASNLASSQFPDGVVYIDLYAFHGQAEPAWNTIANRISGPEAMDRWPARDRATEACRARRILVVIEGGEEADGSPGRASIPLLFSVLTSENRWLLLTRLSTQAATAETVDIRDALLPQDAAALLDSLTENRPLRQQVRQAVLELLEGHPLALNWAANLLARDEEDPDALVTEWKGGRLPKLSNPHQAERTLHWIFERSVRGLDDIARQVLSAAGLIARAPFPLGLVVAGLGGNGDPDSDKKRALEALKTLVQRGLLRRAEKDHWQFSHALGYQFARDEDTSNPALRQRLGVELSNSLAAKLHGSSPETLVGIGDLLQHATALLRADSDQILWEVLASHLLYSTADRLEEVGRLDLVTVALNSLGGWLARLPEAKAKEPFWRNQYCVLLVDRGDVLREQGALPGALAAYRESLAISQSMVEAQPSSADWQRHLSVSQERIGDVLRDRGELPGALAAFREALLVRERLSGTDPLNTVWRRDLSVAQNKIGDVLHLQENLNGSLAAYRESLAVIQQLADSEPSNADWQRDVSVSQERIGNVLRAQGNLKGALEAYRAALVARQGLTKMDPSNAGLMRDVSVSHNKLGDVLQDQQDLPGALAAYREALAVMRPLAEADPSNAGWQRDVTVSQEGIGDVLRSQGNLPDALAAYRETLTVRQSLAAADPSNAGWQRDLSVNHNRIGDVLMEQGNSPGALLAHREALAAIRPLTEADPTHAGWQRDEGFCHERIGSVLLDQGDLRGALTSYEAALEIGRRLVEADRSNTRRQSDLSYTLTQLAEIQEKRNEIGSGISFAEESLLIDERVSALDPGNATLQAIVEESRGLVNRLRAARTLQ